MSSDVFYCIARYIDDPITWSLFVRICSASLVGARKLPEKAYLADTKYKLAVEHNLNLDHIYNNCSGDNSDPYRRIYYKGKFYCALQTTWAREKRWERRFNQSVVLECGLPVYNLTRCGHPKYYNTTDQTHIARNPRVSWTQAVSICDVDELTHFHTLTIDIVNYILEKRGSIDYIHARLFKNPSLTIDIIRNTELKKYISGAEFGYCPLINATEIVKLGYRYDTNMVMLQDAHLYVVEYGPYKTIHVPEHTPIEILEINKRIYGRIHVDWRVCTPERLIFCLNHCQYFNFQSIGKCKYLTYDIIKKYHQVFYGLVTASVVARHMR